MQFRADIKKSWRGVDQEDFGCPWGVTAEGLTKGEKPVINTQLLEREIAMLEAVDLSKCPACEQHARDNALKALRERLRCLTKTA